MGSFGMPEGEEDEVVSVSPAFLILFPNALLLSLGRLVSILHSSIFICASPEACLDLSSPPLFLLMTLFVRFPLGRPHILFLLSRVTDGLQLLFCRHRGLSKPVIQQHQTVLGFGSRIRRPSLPSPLKSWIFGTPAPGPIALSSGCSSSRVPLVSMRSRVFGVKESTKFCHVY